MQAQYTLSFDEKCRLADECHSILFTCEYAGYAARDDPERVQSPPPVKFVRRLRAALRRPNFALIRRMLAEWEELPEETRKTWEANADWAYAEQQIAWERHVQEQNRQAAINARSVAIRMMEEPDESAYPSVQYRAEILPQVTAYFHALGYPSREEWVEQYGRQPVLGEFAQQLCNPELVAEWAQRYGTGSLEEWARQYAPYVRYAG